MHPFAFRRATPPDLPAILTLDELSTREERRDWIRASLTRGELHILEQDGEILAYGALGTFLGHPFIAMLYVARPHRRRGAGETLLERLTHHADAPKVFSSTNLSNAPMHALFLKAGWEVSGLLQHLDENDPEVVYVKRAPRTQV